MIDHILGMPKFQDSLYFLFFYSDLILGTRIILINNLILITYNSKRRELLIAIISLYVFKKVL